MKRRDFIQLGTLGVSVLTLPYISSCTQKSEWTDLIAKPVTLGNFCSHEELLTAGKKYLDKFPGENRIPLLEDLILQDKGDQLFKPASNEELVSFLEKKQVKDFSSGETEIVNGWVLSRTEARQCAVYHLLNKK